MLIKAVFLSTHALQKSCQLKEGARRKYVTVHQVANGQITIVACANAAGQALPPMVIYDAAKLNSAWTKDEVPGTKYGLS